MQPRRRLGFWRFVLAVMLGLGAWWGAGYFSEARPQWRSSNANSNILYPVTENSEGTLALAYELKVQKGQTSAEINDVCIIDANTGRILHAMKNGKGVLDANSYYSLIHAQPRIIGDKAWRVVSHQSENRVTYELRVWDFTRTSTEQVVKQWSLSPGEHFGIAFVDSHSPYFVTQTSQPWHPLLVGMSLEGWSQLTAALAFTPHLDVSNPPGVLIFNTNKFVKTGLVLPCMHSWKLPENLIPLKPLATWAMPPLRKAWQPVMSSDLSWLAFGDTMSVQEWNDEEVQAIRPVGMLRYDGRTGKQLPSPETPAKADLRLDRDTTTPDLIKITATGNVLLVRSTNQTTELFPPYLLDAETGSRISWPAGMTDVTSVRGIHQRKNDPSILLVFCNMPINFLGGEYFNAQDNTYILTLRREGSKLTFLKRTDISSPGTAVVMPQCISGDEIIFQTLADLAPRFVRELCEKYQWLIPYVEKVWPSHQSLLKIFELSSGKCMKTLYDVQPGLFFPFDERHYFFVTRTKMNDMTVSSLEAWRLPLASQTWSPWWSRAIGVMMFLLCIRLLSRKQPVMKLATS